MKNYLSITSMVIGAMMLVFSLMSFSSNHIIRYGADNSMRKSFESKPDGVAIGVNYYYKNEMIFIATFGIGIFIFGWVTRQNKI